MTRKRKKRITLQDLTKAELIELCHHRCFPKLVPRDLALIRVIGLTIKAKELIDKGKMGIALGLVKRIKRLRAEYNLAI